MSPEIHQRIRQLFDEALERPESERIAFIKTACSGDDEAQRTILRLLDAYKPAQSFLEDRPRGMERIGRYLLSGELGRGAMGVVYDAVDPLIGRNVAVKVIHVDALDQNEARFLRERLFREAHSAGQLFHPGIVTVLDVGQEGELAFVAMERVDGISLQRTVASGQKLELVEALDILRQTAAALDFAHGKGVVHCDVKPGNIMLDKTGVVKLTDFGIAKIASTEYHTRTGLLMGTPSHMSPEQIEAHPVDGRSDQFSLAVVAFELLTGTAPFRSESIAGLAHRVVYGPTPSARAANPELPEGVDAVMRRALAKSATDRFETSTQFVSELERALIGAPEPPISVPIPASHVKRWVLATVGVVALGLAGFGVTRVMQPSAPAGLPTLAVPAPVVPPAAPFPAPVVSRFAADPASIKSGELATLRWEVTGAAQVVIEPDVGRVGASDTFKVVKPQSTTVYTIAATGPGGQTTTQQVRVNVEDGNSARALYEAAVAQRRANPDKALPLLRQAAELGDTDAMVDLSDVYWNGQGEEKNYSEAIRWAHMAADRGSPKGMLALGVMHEVGSKSVPPNYVDAVYWLGRAADSGDADAKYNLGGLYERGLGVARDLKQAKKYYDEAAKLGNQEAKDRLAKLGGD